MLTGGSKNTVSTEGVISNILEIEESVNVTVSVTSDGSNIPICNKDLLWSLK